MRAPLLQACLNGARGRDEHPALPTTPAGLAVDAASVADLIASLHVHPRDADGADSLAAYDVAATVEAVRAAAPGIEIGVTTGAWAAPEPADRVAAIRAWAPHDELPDVASVNWHEAGADAVAAALVDRDIRIEAGVWHVEGLLAWARSPLRDRCHRVLVEVQPMPAALAVQEAHRLVRLVGQVSDVPVLLHGEDESAWPVLREAARLGLATRIGLEDALTLPTGEHAPTNRALVEAAVALRGAVR